MRETNSRIRRIIYLEWFEPKITYIFLFWVGTIYFIFALIYHFLQPVWQLFAFLKIPPSLYYLLPSLFLKGLEAVLNYFFGADISVVIGPLIAIAGMALKYLEQARQKEMEEKLKEIEFSPINKAREALIKYYPEAEREGWLGRLSEIIKKRQEEFIEEILENKDAKLLEILKKLGVNGERIEFLSLHIKDTKEEADWSKLCENLPKYLEKFGGKENWRKVLENEAAKCADNLPVEELWEKWFGQQYGRRLLKVPKVWEKLADDQRNLLGPRVEIPWPMQGKRPERPEIKKWCEAQGLKFNPFGPEFAEGDLLLPNYYVEPDFWKDLLVPRPAIVLGSWGSGKSALFFYLLYYLREDYKSFQGKTLGIPISTIRPASDSLVFYIAEAFALRTLKLAANNPFVFLESPQKLHFYRLWKLFIPDVKAKFAAEGLGEPLLTLLMKEIKSLEPIPKLAQVPSQRLEELINPCTPLLEEFDFVYLIIDVKGLTVQFNELIKWLESWVTIIPLLLGANFYPKIICLGDINIVPTFGWEWDVFDLKWDETKLAQMVESRVKSAGVESFNALFDPTLRWKDWALEMAKAAKGSPRKLIRMGNEIILRAANHLDSPSIIEKDLKGILL